MKERQFLIEFKSEELQQNNLVKEELIRELAEKRRQLRELIGNREEGVLTSRDWTQEQIAWERDWKQMRLQCEQNQEFMKHSLRNLEMLSDNLMRLLGQLTLYSRKGTKIDLSVHRPSGKVVEGSY